jgi:hypothetical protein
MKKYTYQEVYNIFKKEKWVLLSTSYKDNKQPLDVLCQNGHKFTINLNNFLTGWRCFECSGRRKLNIDIIRTEFNKIHYKLLSPTYLNSWQKLDYICDKGHHASITYAHFYMGKRCKKCHYIHFSGKNHPNWKELTLKDRRTIKSSKKAIKWRLKVYKRDNFTCQCCGDKTSDNLNAHHLEGWHWCKELRFEVSNGVTLCKDCHKLFHKQHTMMWNTSEQFYQFLRKL